MNRARLVLLVIAVVLGVTAGVVIHRWSHNRPPYGPDVLGATGTLELTTYDAAQQALDETYESRPQRTGPRNDGPIHALAPQPGDQLILGRVTWRPPPRALDGGYFTIILLDKRTHLMPSVFAVASPRQESISMGGDGSLTTAAQRYPWLEGAGGHQIDGEWWTSGSTISAADADSAPVTFEALFPQVDQPMPPRLAIPTAPVAVSDLLLALVYVGSDQQVYWAQRLAG